MDLMLGYKENHGLEFPAIPAPPLLFLYIRDLALPRTFAVVQIYHHKMLTQDSRGASVCSKDVPSP